jgi:hypothetical protein
MERASGVHVVSTPNFPAWVGAHGSYPGVWRVRSVERCLRLGGGSPDDNARTRMRCAKVSGGIAFRES